MASYRTKQNRGDSSTQTDQDRLAVEEKEHRVSPEARRTVTSPGGFSMNAVIGWILQGGVLLSSTVIFMGMVLWLIRAGQHANQQLLAFPHTLGEVVSGLSQFRSQAIIALGLLLLLATPVVRVAASIIAFALEHDRRYVIITTVVLLILMLSFFLGKGAG